MKGYMSAEIFGQQDRIVIGIMRADDPDDRAVRDRGSALDEVHVRE